MSGQQLPRADRRRVSSGSPYEDTVGFSRAIRVGDRVLVAGTAPIWPDGEVDPDPERQAERCFAIVLQALREVGAEAADVVRTRMYLVDAEDAEAVARAHRAAFADARPVATMAVVAGLVDARWRVEVEAEAVIGA
jgi:enamine deaminase RidA (YjgF/YER057c/UK114 family)